MIDGESEAENVAVEGQGGIHVAHDLAGIEDLAEMPEMVEIGQRRRHAFDQRHPDIVRAADDPLADAHGAEVPGHGRRGAVPLQFAQGGGLGRDVEHAHVEIEDAAVVPTLVVGAQIVLLACVAELDQTDASRRGSTAPRCATVKPPTSSQQAR